jgi:hypothetical protein
VLLKEGSGVVGAEPDAQAPSPDVAAATPKADPIEPDAATTVPQVEPLPQPPVAPQTEPLPTPEPLPILNGVDIAAALVLLDAGSKLAYRRANGSEVQVEKKSDQYWVSEKDDSGYVTVGAAGLEEMAAAVRARFLIHPAASIFGRKRLLRRCQITELAILFRHASVSSPNAAHRTRPRPPAPLKPGVSRFRATRTQFSPALRTRTPDVLATGPLADATSGGADPLPAIYPRTRRQTMASPLGLIWLQKPDTLVNPEIWDQRRQ